jgi:hypothetical protein
MKMKGAQIWNLQYRKEKFRKLSMGAERRVITPT